MKDGGTKIIELTDTLLGKGGQGSTYLGLDKEGQELAIKVTDLSIYKVSDRNHRYNDFERELDYL